MCFLFRFDVLGTHLYVLICDNSYVLDSVDNPQQRKRGESEVSTEQN